MLENSSAVQEMRELWLEYETQATDEAKIVKEIDRLEMLIQACEYEKSDGKDLEKFFNDTKRVFQHPFIESISEIISKERLKKIE